MENFKYFENMPEKTFQLRKAVFQDPRNTQTTYFS